MDERYLASFPGPAQLSVACSTGRAWEQGYEISIQHRKAKLHRKEGLNILIKHEHYKRNECRAIFSDDKKLVNLLHCVPHEKQQHSKLTSSVGTALNLQLIRRNQQCNVSEALAPVDINLQYDFNYQQFTYLPNEVKVLPVSSYHKVAMFSCNTYNLLYNM